MKHIILMFTFFLFLTGVSGAKEVSVLQDKNGVSYEVNSETPYTGKLVEWRLNGKKRFEVNWKNGKQDGVSTRWYANGQKEYEANYKDGKLDGIWTHWDENGQKFFLK